MMDVIEIPLTQGQVALVDAEDCGKVSGYKWTAFKDGAGYRPGRSVHADGKVHRVYLYYCILEAPPGMLIDHINRNPLDNRKANLRFATFQQNCFNRRYKNYKHGYKGICWFEPSKKFQARIVCDGRTYFLGYHETAEEAALAYDRKAIELHGEFACLNFPELGGIRP